ncbi:hypothetical protein EXU57_06910 [Segetibacter sp. 3557_3]|uniref:sulfite exporter TauE/SafE family protein n=1 Tax=Segetibacter sp. 3557_3 TaxID=2547429 RepID=UPI00105855DC|nr:sulfite exporter TauE/SafE family protein [Segetibacter sp. 3557_3]TDH27313.1 hypothetical protein EXU57_06910 [Segetibacter sp. 3557_3]
MTAELSYLVLTAITISLVHTITGPDHYLPFIALSKSKGWSLRRTVFWTLVCGIGHVGSSVALGLGGVALGWSLAKISWLENVRGGLAGWTMLIIGCVYCLYAFWQLSANKLHKHFEADENNIYVYEHRHGTMVLPREKTVVTPWIMFIVFLLGPCEPLIPLLSFPAVKHSITGVVVLVGVFTVFTLCAMVTMVLLGYYGLSLFDQRKMEKYAHVLAGTTVLVCGAGMLFMGW